mgnify:CR=1 FL=1
MHMRTVAIAVTPMPDAPVAVDDAGAVDVLHQRQPCPRPGSVARCPHGDATTSSAPTSGAPARGRGSLSVPPAARRGTRARFTAHGVTGGDTVPGGFMSTGAGRAGWKVRAFAVVVT